MQNALLVINIFNFNQPRETQMSDIGLQPRENGNSPIGCRPKKG
jgi:hypothetical protein